MPLCRCFSFLPQTKDRTLNRCVKLWAVFFICCLCDRLIICPGVLCCSLYGSCLWLHLHLLARWDERCRWWMDGKLHLDMLTILCKLGLTSKIRCLTVKNVNRVQLLSEVEISILTLATVLSQCGKKSPEEIKIVFWFNVFVIILTLPHGPRIAGSLYVPKVGGGSLLRVSELLHFLHVLSIFIIQFHFFF